MQLEKVLEEIDVKIAGSMGKKREGLLEARDIIRKHLSSENAAEIKRSSRDNDGWIPVEERLPEENGDDGELIVTDKDGRIWSGIYYGITEETDEYPCFHKWDEEMWYCYKPDVIAWRPLPEPYHPESEKEKPDWRQDMLRKFDRRE